MATAAEKAVLRDANATIEALALARLRDFWASLPLTRPEVARDALLEFVPVLTTEFGDMAAVVAADWYDELRATEGIPGEFRAVMAASYPAVYVEQRVRYGARHLFTDAPGQMLDFLDGAVQGYVLQPGRDTIQLSSVRDPKAAGWHRETRASSSFASGCGFCQVLAGRGGVYKWDAAPFAAHDDCHCVAVPSWDANAPEVPADAYAASVRTKGMTPEERDRHFSQIRDLARLEDVQRL